MVTRCRANVARDHSQASVEILEQLPGLDAIFIAVGGGGLIGGVGSVLKAQNPNIRIYGCQPAASAVMAHSVEAGELLDLPSEPTLSDGTAGGIEAGAITFALNQAVVDEWAQANVLKALDTLVESAAKPDPDDPVPDNADVPVTP